ncbi:MAG TPA: RNA pseudouridine synthase [Stellaceae bacterium]|nr:RNA pseudouridine synthase [Stellaceae bacterium]
MNGISLADRVLYRDGLVLVIDKPAGLPVHAGPGGGANLEALFDGLRFGLPQPPHLAHRLDRDTSGCLVLGRHAKALRRLGALFAEGKVGKTYWAVVEGVPSAAQGQIETGLTKQSHGRGWRMIVDSQGQRAATQYRVLAAAGGRAWLELKPLTGRTHQIRVHCASLGTPVAGDHAYGRAQAGRPLLLHARRIMLPLYPGRPPLDVTAPPPPHMLAALRGLGYDACFETRPSGAPQREGALSGVKQLPHPERERREQSKDAGR